MRKLVYILFIIVGLLGRPGVCYGQHAEKVAQSLAGEGFENIRALYADSSYIFTFENPVYRSVPDALRLAMQLAANSLPPESDVKILLLEKDLPRVVVSFRAGDWLSFLGGDLSPRQVSRILTLSEDTREIWFLVRQENPLRSGAGKSDLVVYPQFAFENTQLDQIYEIQLNVAPAWQISLWRGGQLTGQVILPLYNELGHEGDFVRPGQLFLSQDFRAEKLTARVAAGNFGSSRYGGDLSLSYLLPDENWKLKLRMGLTGSSHFIDGEWMHTPVRTLTYALQGSWFIPRWNIDLEGGVRQYLYGDTGLYGSCTRWFGQTAVGFYAMAGEESFNGGFHFTFAFPVRKRPRNHLFRVTLPTHQDMVYNAGTEFYYGQDYRVGPGTNRVREFYNAAYLKNELLKK